MMKLGALVALASSRRLSAFWLGPRSRLETGATAGMWACFTLITLLPGRCQPGWSPPAAATV